MERPDTHGALSPKISLAIPAFCPKFNKLRGEKKRNPGMGGDIVPCVVATKKNYIMPPLTSDQYGICTTLVYITPFKGISGSDGSLCCVVTYDGRTSHL